MIRERISGIGSVVDSMVPTMPSVMLTKNDVVIISPMVVSSVMMAKMVMTMMAVMICAKLLKQGSVDQKMASPYMISITMEIVSQELVLAYVLMAHSHDSSTTQGHTPGLGLVLVVAVDLMSPVVLMKIDVETL